MIISVKGVKNVIGFLIVFLAILVIIFGVLIYKQETTKFTTSTNYSLIDIWTKPEIKKASYFMEQLDKVEGEHEVLLNVDIPYDNNTYHADAILIHESGLYILTSVYKSGWIVGHEQNTRWVEIGYKNTQESFDNPIFENRRIMLGLQEILPEINREALNNIVIFGGGCSFQSIEVMSDNIEVLKLSELKQWKKTIHGELFGQNEISEIYEALKPYSNLKKVHKEQSKTKVVTS